ncbi:MAG: RodZ domain-containing protein [Leptolyngbyaceae bacterium]|nr:RodZ domain-containing protein [Leptolyngbyaceae bacterium]
MGQQTTQPSERQVEALMQIGGYLHEVREGQLLALEQVAEQTLIQARLLRAIETADFHQLPEPVYIRGFIRRYAEALGLDGSVVASKFPVEIDGRSIQPSWNKSTSQLRPTHLWIAYTVIIIVAIGGLQQYLARFSSPASQASDSLDSEVAESAPESFEEPPSSSDESSVAESSSPDLTPEPLDESLLSSSELANTEDDELTQAETFPAGADPDSPLKVTLELTQRSWLRIIVDGKQELEEVLPEGTQQTWVGSQNITIRAGNAGGVLVAQNGGDEELMGDPGAVREVTFTVDSSDSPDNQAEDDAD